MGMLFLILSMMVFPTGLRAMVFELRERGEMPIFLRAISQEWDE